jgi:hypothetical protein
MIAIFLLASILMILTDTLLLLYRMRRQSETRDKMSFALESVSEAVLANPKPGKKEENVEVDSEKLLALTEVMDSKFPNRYSIHVQIFDKDKKALFQRTFLVQKL